VKSDLLTVGHNKKRGLHESSLISDEEDTQNLQRFCFHHLLLGVAGAFRVEMSRLPGNDRMIQCRYYPMEIGVYDVYVLWSGEHVPGSPFRVNIVDTMEQLRTLAEQLEIAVDPNKLDYGTTSSRSSASSRGGSTLRGLMFTDDY